MSLDAKLQRMTEKVSANQDAQKVAKQALWERIKTDAPEVADFLTTMKQAFGQPKRVAVWIGEERVL